jgi:hypothetical protein
MLALQSLVKQLNDVLTGDIGSSKALGPSNQNSSVDASLLDREGEGKSELLSLSSIVFDSFSDTFGNEVK